MCRTTQPPPISDKTLLQQTYRLKQLGKVHEGLSVKIHALFSCLPKAIRIYFLHMFLEMFFDGILELELCLGNR